MIILDTNVVSALMRDPPTESVLRWLDSQPRLSIWTTSVTLLEIKFGLEIMADGRRRAALDTAFDRFVTDALKNRIAPFDSAAARDTAALMGQRHRNGLPRDIRDAMIAGIALSRRATIATGNVKHFDDAKIGVVDPWRP